MPLAITVDLTRRTSLPLAVPAVSIAVEQLVLVELNRARTDPAALARALRTVRRYYHGKLLARPSAPAIYLTQEGVALVEEAIAFVDAEVARAPLSSAVVLTAAAADHLAEQRQDGRVGHAGRDGSTPADRMLRRGGNIYVGELITYGSADPAEIVRQLVVDDGVADRSHRRLLFDASLRYVGISCGNHPVYRYMCVVTVGRTPDGQPIGSRRLPRP